MMCLLADGPTMSLKTTATTNMKTSRTHIRALPTPNIQSSATATGGWVSNGTMTIKFHFSVKSEGAVAVGCSDLLGVRST